MLLIRLNIYQVQPDRACPCFSTRNPYARLPAFGFPPNCGRFPHTELLGSGAASVQPHGLLGGCYCLVLNENHIESAVPVFVKLEKGCVAFACPSGVVPHCSPVSPHLSCSDVNPPSQHSFRAASACVKCKGGSLTNETCKKLQKKKKKEGKKSFRRAHVRKQLECKRSMGLQSKSTPTLAGGLFVGSVMEADPPIINSSVSADQAVG